MMNMMVKDVYRNFSAASEKVLVPKICVLDRGQLTDGGGGGGRGGGGVQTVPSSIKSVTYFLQCVVIFV